MLPTYTDLGSLIGIFDSGYSTVWKFSKVPCTLILREVNFDGFQKIKNFRLTILVALNFDFWKKFKIQSCSNGQNGSFGASKWAKLVWRKIWVAEKYLCSCKLTLLSSNRQSSTAHQILTELELIESWFWLNPHCPPKMPNCCRCDL